MLEEASNKALANDKKKSMKGNKQKFCLNRNANWILKSLMRSSNIYEEWNLDEAYVTYVILYSKFWDIFCNFSKQMHDN